MIYTGIMAFIDIISEKEPSEEEVCLNFDEFFNKCTEFGIGEETGKPFWLNLMFMMMSVLIVIFYVPMLMQEYKKLRYGYRSTWDDEFKK